MLVLCTLGLCWLCMLVAVLCLLMYQLCQAATVGKASAIEQTFLRVGHKGDPVCRPQTCWQGVPKLPICMAAQGPPDGDAPTGAATLTQGWWHFAATWADCDSHGCMKWQPRIPCLLLPGARGEYGLGRHVLHSSSESQRL